MPSDTQGPPGRSGRNVWVLAAGLCAIAALSPVVFGHFGFTDDYTYLYWQQTDPKPLADLLRSLGRPLAIPIIELLFRLFPTVDGLRWIRLLGVLGAGGCAASLTWIALRLGYRAPLAFLAGATLAGLPGVVVAGTWATLVHGTWAMLAALWAGAWILRGRLGLVAGVLVTAQRAARGSSADALAWWPGSS